MTTNRSTSPLFHDRDILDRLLREVVAAAGSFSNTIGERPAGLPVLPELPPLAPGQGAEATLRYCRQYLDRLVTATTSPRYLGYVTGGVTPAALLGDWLASLYDQNPQGLRAFGDASGNIEVEAIGLLQELFSLPDDFHGGFVTGATMSNFTCLGVARQWVGQKQGYDVAKEGLKKPIHILAATPHSSAVKSLAMLGLGSGNITRIDTLPGHREAMDVADLTRKAEALNGEPFIVIASGGTVNTVDFDDLTAIVALRERFDFWLHVDAAFGGFAVLRNRARPQAVPERSRWVQGKELEQWEAADSITVDNHKWLNVPYDSGTWFIRREHLDLQVNTFQNSSAPYLGDPAKNYNFLNLGPENSRRLRALPVWFTLKAYGKAGYEDIVNRSIDTAVALGEALSESQDFELLAPVRLNVVVFTLTNGTAQDVDRLVHELNDDGRYFMTSTTLWGRRGVRAAFVNWQHHVGQVPDIVAALTSALKKN